MPSFKERLQEAVGPRYLIGEEIGGGGMGVVYRAHDTRLDCAVAVKTLRPEHATASAVERFRFEARTLANHRHPNIVPIHDYDSRDGIDFFVMALLEGETVGDRIAHGGFTLPEVRRLAEDLLDALAYAHRRGVVHRDVKPSNVFLEDGRAILTDFGIVKAPGQPGEPRTDTGEKIGTPGYWCPEQSQGAEVTPSCDVYSTGILLYEAITRRDWEAPRVIHWAGVPPAIRPVLQRATAAAPTDRWADAAEFRKALVAAFGPRWWKRVAWSVGVGSVAVLGWLVVGCPRSPGICIGDFKVLAGPPYVADSMRRMIVGELTGFTDFQARAGSHCDVDLYGSVRAVGDSLYVQVVAPSGPLPRVAGTVGAWQRATDAVVDQITTQVWNDSSPLAGSLPPLPVTPQGKAAELRAERMQAAGRWTEALRAYLEAEAIDSTCWLCAWRITDVQRWLGMPLVPVESRRYLDHLADFPLQYRNLINAGRVPMPQRLDTLRRAVQEQAFFLAWFHLGDELFHRGPLYGHARREALEPFERTVALRKDYAPGWEHLAYLRIAEGDSAGARIAIDSFLALSDTIDPMAGVLLAFDETGFAWRFRSAAEAIRVTEGVLSRRTVQGFPALAAGPRLLPTVESPTGAVWLGNRFAGIAGRSDLQRSGLIAATAGWLALGRLDSMQATAARLRQTFPDEAVARFVAQLFTAVAVFDTGGLGPTTGGTWLDGLVGGRVHSGTPPAVRRLLRADSIARGGDYQGALAVSASLAVDSAAQHEDPFLRTALFLRRAQWSARINDLDLARRTLYWHQHSSLQGWPTGDPEANDVDWAFGTVAEWQLARLLDGAGETGRGVCSAYSTVARLWSGGDAVHKARADIARRRHDELKCPA